MSGQEMTHVQQLAEWLRSSAGRLGGNGAEVWAIGYLGRHVNATTDVELREAGEALRDVLAALTIVQSEHEIQVLPHQPDDRPMP